MTVFVVGAEQPQLSGMICALALADILSKRGSDALPVTREEPAAATREFLRRMGLSAPVKTALLPGQQTALAGRKDAFAGLPGLTDATVVISLDAECFAALSAEHPQVSWAWPKGCAATLLKALYDFYGMEISKGLACGLLAACLEETENLAPGTSTDGDAKAAAALAAAAGIADLQAFGREVLGK